MQDLLLQVFFMISDFMPNLLQVIAELILTLFTFADPKDQAKVDSAAHLILFVVLAQVLSPVNH